MSETDTSPSPKTFKLQVHIPWDLYEQLLTITGQDRIYGGLSRITILALRQYLNPVQPLSDEEI